MVNMTRLDCVIGAASGMRQGAVMAVHHASHRQAFGRYLVDQPLMRNVLADLVVESEAATILMLRLAGAPEALRRLALPAAKYWVCKRAPGHAAEALECLGGNGYVEESGAPRLFRESPLNSIWEGSGNVAALDVLRAIGRQPEAVDAYRAEVSAAAGADARLDAAAREVEKDLEDTDESRARRSAERLALVLQGALLVRYGHPAVADAFCASRLGGDHGGAYGTLPDGVDTGAVIARATPVVH
jgi:putative acyl-CoA dehydrogenase